MTRSGPGLLTRTANFTGQVEDWARQAITDDGATTWRDTETDTSYDTGTTDPDFGLPLYAFRHGDLSQPSQQACTSYTYALVNTGENLAGLPAEIQTDAAPCGGSNPGGSSAPGAGQVNALTAPASLDYATQVISDTRTYYDTTLATGSPLTPPAFPQTTALTTADATLIQEASGYDSTAKQLTFQTTAATAFDSYGRPVKSYDGNGGWNGITYAPTATSYTMTNGSTTAVTVTNPLSQSVTTAYDPVRGLPVKITDPNNITTTLQYDELGRLTGVWEYNRTIGSTPDLAYTYAVNNNAPTVVTTKKLNDLGGQTTTTWVSPPSVERSS